MNKHLLTLIKISGYSRKDIIKITGFNNSRFSEWIGKKPVREIQYEKLKDISDKLGYTMKVVFEKI